MLRAVVGMGLIWGLVGLVGVALGMLIRATMAATTVLVAVNFIIPVIGARLLPDAVGDWVTTYWPISAGLQITTTLQNPERGGALDGAGRDGGVHRGAAGGGLRAVPRPRHVNPASNAAGGHEGNDSPSASVRVARVSRRRWPPSGPRRRRPLVGPGRTRAPGRGGQPAFLLTRRASYSFRYSSW